MTEEEYLENTAELGHKALQFIESDIGKALIKRAEDVESEALNKLRTVDPVNADLIRDLQKYANYGKDFRDWLAEMIQEGYQAEQSLDQPEE